MKKEVKNLCLLDKKFELSGMQEWSVSELRIEMSLQV